MGVVFDTAKDETEAQFRWTSPCECTYKLVITDSSGHTIFNTTTTKPGADVEGLPEAEPLRVVLYTTSKDRSFARDYTYTVR